MADDFLQSTVSGTSYVRGRSMYFENPRGGVPSVLIRLEEVTTLADGRVVTRDAGEINKSFDDMNTSFNLRNPETNEVIQDATITYQDVFVSLFSAFWHLAEEHQA